jgi:hypothetical protein
MIDCAEFNFLLFFLRYAKAMNLERLLQVPCQGGECLSFFPCDATKIDLFNPDRTTVTILKTLKQGEGRDETRWRQGEMEDGWRFRRSNWERCSGRRRKSFNFREESIATLNCNKMIRISASREVSEMPQRERRRVLDMRKALR